MVERDGELGAPAVKWKRRTMWMFTVKNVLSNDLRQTFVNYSKYYASTPTL